MSADVASIWRTASMCCGPRSRPCRTSSVSSVRISVRPSRRAAVMCTPSGSGGNARSRSVRGARALSASATATRRIPSASSRSMAHTSASHDAASRATPCRPASGSSDRASISLACSSSSRRSWAGWTFSSLRCSSATLIVPAGLPSASLTGALTTRMRMREPSLRSAGISPSHTPPPRTRLRSSPTTAGSARPPRRSVTGRPTASRASHPNRRSAWWFQATIVPLAFVTMIAAGARSINSASAMPTRAISESLMSRAAAGRDARLASARQWHGPA